MIRHIVMFKFKDEADGRSRDENVRLTMDMLEALPAKIDYIKYSFVSSYAKGQAADNYDLILISDFESLETLEKYKVHPDHVAVGNFMRPLRLDRKCIDFEI